MQINKNIIFNLLKIHSKKKFNIVDKYQNSSLQKEYKNEKKIIKKLFFKEVSQKKIKQSRLKFPLQIKLKTVGTKNADIKTPSDITTIF